MNANAEPGERGGAGSLAAAIEEVRVRTADGMDLAATLHEPSRGNGLVVQVNSANATPRSYYRHFASHLARRGFAVLCYDFRGTGDSGGGNPFGEAASPLAWGGEDTPAASRFLLERYPGSRLVVVGHSMGGQILGLSPLIGQTRAIQLVACAHGHWRRWPDRRTRWKLAFLWHFSGPLALSLLGDVPAWVTGGRDTPRRLAIEMGRFVRSPHFLCAPDGAPLRPHNADIRCPVRHYVFSDDDVVPPGADIDLEEFFPNASRERVLLTPGELDSAAVGHFGFFRRTIQAKHWDGVADWLIGAAGR